MSWPHILQSLTIETLILEETFTIIVRAFKTAGRLLAISLSSWLPKITRCFLNKNNPLCKEVHESAIFGHCARPPSYSIVKDSNADLTVGN